MNKNLLTLLAFCALCFYSSAQNPIVTHKYTADPSARVFNGKVYVYTSHDRDDATYFDMVDWACFSSDDMINWKDEGTIFSLDDISWADTMAWAPDCIERNGKYYFYYPVARAQIGVAVSNSPTGPFKDPIGKPLVCNTEEPFAGKEPIDPAILIDDDGQAYMYFGCREARVTKLKKNMIERKGKLKELEIYDNEGNKLLWKAKKKGEPNLQKFHGGDGAYGEGPWILKKDGIYFLLYANGWSQDGTMVYATAKKPMGPFTYQGKVMNSVSSGTSHGSIVEYKGEWYVFYHTKDLSGNNFKRSICVDRLTWDSHGKIIPVTPTREGLSKK